MGNLICPLVPLFPRAYLLPVPLCLGAHLPQRLFISKSISPGANLPRCLLCQCPFSPSPYLHSACSPFIPRTHLLWFPLLLVSTFLVTHFPGAHFPKCRFGPIQKRLFPCDPCYGKLLNAIMFVRQLPIRSRVDPPDLLLNDHQLRSLLYVIMVLRLSRSVVVILINAWLELAAFCWN